MSKRGGVGYWLGSIAIHAVALVVLAWAAGTTGVLAWPSSSDRPRADTVTIVWQDEREPDEPGAGSREPGGMPVAIRPEAVAGAAARPGLRDTVFSGIDLGDLGGEEIPPVSIRPGYGDGRLWVRPGRVLADGGVVAAGDAVGDVSAPLDPDVHAARIDSVLAQRIVAFLDTLPPDSFAYNLTPPSWTTEVDGRTWGIDQQWIYLGDFKLPTVLLGLLPIGGQGNYEQGQRAAELQRIREDLLRAASRAADAQDFRRYVNELRERRDAERRQNQDQDN